MSDVLGWLALGLVAAGLVALGWWLLIASEGVYLGRRVVIWLYDLFADRYDEVKHFRREYDHMFLAQPIMEQIAPHQSPLVLDIATGTARLPLALLHHTHFQGRVIGLDLSRRMLAVAANKLVGSRQRAPLLWASAEALPFSDDLFDVVICLEALEFMEQPDAVMGEAVRVLRPGGLLLVTSRINTRLMPGKIYSNQRLGDLLEALGVRDVDIDYWQVDYHRVWGRKQGESMPTGARPLGEILRCPRCHQTRLVETRDAWCCSNCQFQAMLGGDGVIELFKPNS